APTPPQHRSQGEESTPCRRLPDSCLALLHYKGSVRATETEGVRKDCVQRCRPRFVRNDAKIGTFIWSAKMDVRRKKLMLEREKADNSFDRAGRAQRVAHHALGRTDRHAATEKLADCFALGRVVKRRGCSVRVDVIDRTGRKLGALESLLHRLAGSTAGRVRLSKMKIVSRNAVPSY